MMALTMIDLHAFDDVLSQGPLPGKFKRIVASMRRSTFGHDRFHVKGTATSTALHLPASSTFKLVSTLSQHFFAQAETRLWSKLRELYRCALPPIFHSRHISDGSQPLRVLSSPLARAIDPDHLLRQLKAHPAVSTSSPNTPVPPSQPIVNSLPPPNPPDGNLWPNPISLNPSLRVRFTSPVSLLRNPSNEIGVDRRLRHR